LRYSLLVAYDGTDFHGWQKQAGLRTVQGDLEQAVQMVVREQCNVVGASRTDAGVHARGQVAAFSTDADIEPRKLAAAVNSRLPEDIRVRRATLCPEGFSPISEAVAKGYRYRFHCGSRPLGTHDFASMTRLHHGRESTVRTVHDCMVTRTGRRRLRVDICGDGFLHNMVRIIAGTLIEVGRRRMKPDEMERVLGARDRTAAGQTLPPEGLFLMWVKYA
jgi:tRNA pseudouridine38-40 synthase